MMERTANDLLMDGIGKWMAELDARRCILEILRVSIAYRLRPLLGAGRDVSNGWVGSKFAGNTG
jgi:hypothetical protein